MYHVIFVSKGPLHSVVLCFLVFVCHVLQAITIVDCTGRIYEYIDLQIQLLLFYCIVTIWERSGLYYSMDIRMDVYVYSMDIILIC
jgi:hypothetical protein